MLISIFLVSRIESVLNPRGVLDFSTPYIFSKGIFKWQVESNFLIFKCIILSFTFFVRI